VESGSRGPRLSYGAEVGVEVVTEAKIQGQLGHYAEVILEEGPKSEGPHGEIPVPECYGCRARRISQHGVECGIKQAGVLRIVTCAGQVAVVPAEFEEMPAGGPREFL